LLRGLLLRGAVLAVFLVSGAAGLAYEVVWTRALSLVFGVTAFGSQNPVAEEGGRNPSQIFDERMQFYFAQRRSVLPHLDNLGGEDPRAVEARIAAHAKQLPFPSGGRFIAEADWRRP
jgi:hypothetical protein